MSKEKQMFEDMAEAILEDYAGAYCRADKESLARYIRTKCDEYNAGYRKQTEWISVDERLPTYKDGKVLIYTAYGISVAERTTSNRWRGNCAIPKLITHWMPLPVAPRGGE